MKKLSIFLILILFCTAPAFAETVHYTCPMHPHYIATEPGSCPICGMTLVAVTNDENSGQLEKNADWSKTEARTAVTIAPETIQNMGVRTEKAQTARFGSTIRSYGTVGANVRLLNDISGRVAGWIETLNITAVGDTVKKGDRLFTLYSPELVSAQQDYLSALSTGIKGRINSSARRLSALGMQQNVIDTLRKTRDTFQDVPFYALRGGVVAELHIRRGSYVMPGMTIAKIQDYASVWVEAAVAEKDLRFLHEGGKAVVGFPNLGGVHRDAVIDYIYPTIDAASRTGRIRLILDNNDGALRPGSYADIVFETDIQNRLSVPSEAILKSSEGDFVVRAETGGRFQPQKIISGLQSRRRTEILSGVAEGDEIVVSGQFLIDSESSLRESFRKMQRMRMPLSLLEVDGDQLAMIDHLADAAIYLQKSLTGEETFRPDMLMPAFELGSHLLPQFRGTRLERILKDAEQAVIAAQNSMTDDALKKALKQLMQALSPWLLEGRPDYYREKGLFLFEDHDSGALWLQTEKQPANPYGGGHTMQKDWPAPSKADMPDMTEQPAGGGHVH